MLKVVSTQNTEGVWVLLVQNLLTSFICCSVAKTQVGSGVYCILLIYGVLSAFDFSTRSYNSSFDFCERELYFKFSTCFRPFGMSARDSKAIIQPASSNTSSYTWDGPFVSVLTFIFSTVLAFDLANGLFDFVLP